MKTCISETTFAKRRLTARTKLAIVYVMNTKLTLRIDDVLVHQAKVQAAQRGKSVSQMFSEFVQSLGASRRAPSLPPITGSLLGIMKSHPMTEDDYKQHLQEKHS